MSDDQQETPATTTGEQQAGEWKAPASQDELDRIIQNRLERERAKFADVDELREKARYWDEIEQASKTEYEKAQEEATRWQTEATTWRTKAVSSRVERLAAEAFADPSDALAGLGDPAKYLGVGGDIDESAIKSDLDALLERKPHWRKQAEQAQATYRVPAPNPAQGSGGGAPISADPAQVFASTMQNLLQR